MLRKLLITSLLFTALFTVSCEKLKELTGGVTEPITGIDKTYAGPWVAQSEDINSVFFGSRMVIDENGGMTYQDAKASKQLIFESSAILKLGDSYTAIYTENNPDDPSITDTYTLVIKFNSTTEATVNYTKSVANNTSTGENGIFKRQ
ncbi:hypothetical protein [Brachyspira intermedia]|uniref:hypothetical protein n=1 Tax=Brachyspira intermedia TaxID=84377 RepID=UPI00300441AB